MEIMWYKNEFFTSFKKRTLLLMGIVSLAALMMSVIVTVASKDANVGLFVFLFMFFCSIPMFFISEFVERRNTPTDVSFSEEGFCMKYKNGREETMLWSAISRIEVGKPLSWIPLNSMIYDRNGKQMFPRIAGEPARELYDRFEEFKKRPGVTEDLGKLKISRRELFLTYGAYVSAIAILTFAEILFGYLYMSRKSPLLLILAGTFLILTILICVFVLRDIRKIKNPRNTK